MSSLHYPQFFAGRREDLAAVLCYHHRVFDADAAETLEVDAGLDGDRAARSMAAVEAPARFTLQSRGALRDAVLRP